MWHLEHRTCFFVCEVRSRADLHDAIFPHLHNIGDYKSRTQPYEGTSALLSYFSQTRVRLYDL